MRCLSSIRWLAPCAAPMLLACTGQLAIGGDLGDGGSPPASSGQGAQGTPSNATAMVMDAGALQAAQGTPSSIVAATVYDAASPPQTVFDAALPPQNEVAVADAARPVLYDTGIELPETGSTVFSEAATPQVTWLAFDSDRGGTVGGNPTRGIYLIRSDGTGLMRLTTSSANEKQPAFSPDGTKLAYTSDASGVFQIYILNFATHASAQLTTRPYGAQQPAWSRDGARIAFVGLPPRTDLDAGTPPAGSADLFVIGPDGTGERDVTGPLTTGCGYLFYPECYPMSPTFGADSTTVLFKGIESINAIGVDGTGLRQIAGTPTEGTETPSVSPDGTLVAFASYDIKGEGIRTTAYDADCLDPAGSCATLLFVGEQSSRNPAWGPTGYLAFESTVPAFSVSNIALMSPQAFPGPTPLTTGATDDRNPAWAPIGFNP